MYIICIAPDGWLWTQNSVKANDVRAIEIKTNRAFSPVRLAIQESTHYKQHRDDGAATELTP